MLIKSTFAGWRIMPGKDKSKFAHDNRAWIKALLKHPAYRRNRYPGIIDLCIPIADRSYRQRLIV